MRLTLFVVVATYAAGGNDEQEPSDNALGRMSRETASAHVKLINAGLLLPAGSSQRDLCMQLPIGRVPAEGLSRKQKEALRELVEDRPDHPMAWLLTAEPGQSFSHETAYELPFDLSFSASTALRCSNGVDERLARR